MRHSAQHSSDHVCYGIDLNRNFDHKWMGNLKIKTIISLNLSCFVQ